MRLMIVNRDDRSANGASRPRLRRPCSEQKIEAVRPDRANFSQRKQRHEGQQPLGMVTKNMSLILGCYPERDTGSYKIWNTFCRLPKEDRLDSMQLQSP